MNQEERSLVLLEMGAEALRARRVSDDAAVAAIFEIDLSDVYNLLHVLRNPYGWNENTVRTARLVAANYLEALLKQPKEGDKGLCERVERAERERDAAVGQLKRLKQGILAKICD